MAVKTKDLSVNHADFTSEGKEFDAKGKTALKIKSWYGGLGNLNEMCIEGNRLIVKLTPSQKITIKNYKSLKYLKNDNGILEDFIEKGTVANKNEITFNSRNLSATGTIYSDTINASNYAYTPKGKSKKGLTIDGGKGNDSISGTNYNDVIKGGDGNDTIYGGEGNDTITGGKGENTISYKTGDGNDIINLTKGEKFTLNILTADNKDDIKLEYANKNKDVRVYADKNDTNEYITLKNFGTKDDTNSAEIRLHPENTDMDAEPYEINIKDYTFSSNVTKNFTGTWLNDSIDASRFELKDKKGNKIVDTSKKGLTLKGGNGTDTIYGSIYSDVIYSGKDVDFINAGYGNDTIIAGSGKTTVTCGYGAGKDVIDMSKAKDITIDTNLTNDTVGNLLWEYNSNHKDLKIYFNRSDKSEYLTLKNFCIKDRFNNVKITTNSSYGDIDLKDETIWQVDINKNCAGTWLKDKMDAGSYIVYKNKSKNIVDKNCSRKGLVLNGKDGDDSILGSNYSDTIYGGNGDDSLEGNTGNDKIYGGNGDDFIEGGMGNNKIYGGNGNDTIYAVSSTFDLEDAGKNFIDGGDGDDEIYGGKGNDTIYGGKGTDIIYGGDGNDVIYGGDDTKGYDIIEGGAGNDTITGGKGVTFVKYNDNDGKDVINLTKGEFLTITDNTTNSAFPIYSYSENKKDLIISFGASGEQSIRLKNFASKNVADSAVLIKGETALNLMANDAQDSVYITAENVDKNYTGTWLKDAIWANETLYKKVGKNLVEKTAKEKGLVLDGGAGNDSVIGSNCSDTIKGGDGDDSLLGRDGNDKIYGGNGDDYIYGGKGNDILEGGKGYNTYYFEKGDGIDTINVTKGEGILIDLKDIVNYNISYINGNKDLKIQSQTDMEGKDYIILKNFTAKNITNSAIIKNGNNTTQDIKDITINASGLEKSFTGTWLNDHIDARWATKNITLRGGDGNDSIFGGKGNDKIYGDNGNDTIRGSFGNDTITGGKGENHIEYSLGDGNDIINLTKGEDFYLHFEGDDEHNADFIANNAQWDFKGNDLRIWAYGKNESKQYVTIKNAEKMIRSASTAKIVINNEKVLDLKTITDADLNNWKSQLSTWDSSGMSNYSLTSTASTDPVSISTLAQSITPEEYGMV